MQTKQSNPRIRWQVAFFTIWAGQAISLLGSNLAQFALVWWLTKSTGSATVLATATLVALLPGIFLGPLAGALVDRWNRRSVMILADGLVALAAVWLVYLSWAGTLHVWHVYVIMLLRAIGGTFHWPAMQASTSLMVPEEHLSRIGGLNQTLHGIVGIVSPPVGAILLSLLPLHGVMAIDVVTAICAIGLLLTVHIPQPQRSPSVVTSQGKPSLWSDMRAGLQYVWNWPGLRIMLIIATVLNLVFNPAFSLMPLLVTQHFHGEALHLGWLESAWGFGVVLGGLTLGVWGGFRRKVITSILGLLGMGLGTFLVGIAPGSAFPLAVGALFVTGFMNPIASGPLFAVIQAKVAPDMQGRVFTVMMSAASAMSPLGMAIAGPLADWLGVPAWFTLAGAVCILMGLGIPLVPAVMNLEENHNGHQSGDDTNRALSLAAEPEKQGVPGVG